MLHYMIWNRKNLSKVVSCLIGFQHDVHLHQFTDNAVAWLFVLRTIMFSLWTSNGIKQWPINEPTEEFDIMLCYQRSLNREYNTYVLLFCSVLNNILKYEYFLSSY